jgi:hypothetical protein
VRPDPTPSVFRRTHEFSIARDRRHQTRCRRFQWIS